ncbi:peptide chain release factor N(5)-glutamine methyltransferase [Cricetibacter osteomyelitidis]|uniref:peptide chain release factor N(5)-glutamine methyltransferase n=1 Tax=Cricetibacter osteomyelitidis TaxID=1521931 RepID=UPI0024367ABD|nr:peptide chain release factor N(5)-glutamine methyltransferase [Cricetibacter osteomyelitidis]
MVTDKFEVVCEYFSVTKVYEQTYEQWLAFAQDVLQETLTNNSFIDPKFDANVLLSFVTQKNRAQILAFSETILTEAELKHLAQLLVRRVKGEPIAYILGEKEFWSLPLFVSKDTLIPRPDTEILVERAVEIGRNLFASQSTLRILDLGTGTGAIALALASELQPIAQKCGAKLDILGVDRIAEAVQLAQRNAERNQLDFVQFQQSDWFSALDSMDKFHLIVSNPPYIDETDEHLNQGDVRFEPLSALVAQEQGYADLQFIIEYAPHFLAQNGWLLLEHGWQQGEKVRWIFAENHWQCIETVKDYSDNERITLAQFTG